MIRQLKSLAFELKKITNHTKEKLPDLSLDEMISTGISLDDIIKSANSLIDPIKIVLRDEAVTRNKQQSGIIELKPGSCDVQISKPKITVRKDYDLASLKISLGSSFPVLFEEVVTYKPQNDFDKELKKLSQNQQAEVMEAIEMKDISPKVFFKTE